MVNINFVIFQRGNLKSKAAMGTPMGSRMSITKSSANLKEPPKMSMREMTTMLGDDFEMKPLKSKSRQDNYKVPPKNQVSPSFDSIPEINVEVKTLLNLRTFK